jgi:hypothetical protein
MKNHIAFAVHLSILVLLVEICNAQTLQPSCIHAGAGAPPLLQKLPDAAQPA